MSAPDPGRAAESASAKAGVREPLLSVKNLSTVFDLRDGRLVAVDDVSFDVGRGEVFSIVGESGSGKSVTAMSIMRIVTAPGEIVAGTVTFDGEDLRELSERQMRSIRGSAISMIFQDPMTGLNPLYDIGDQVGEPLRAHRGYSRKEAREAAVEALRRVGIPDPEKRVRDRPHEFSGGMRQRAMIAMAMITNPKLLIADEPTTALDVTIQAQILELLAEISEEQNTSVLLISHDLGVVANVSDHMAVMYGGQMHETGTVDQLFDDPHGPYTWGLLAAVPRLDVELGEELLNIVGQPPSLIDRPAGCRFHPRCFHATDRCSAEPPEPIYLSPGHTVRCHFGAEPGWVERRHGDPTRIGSDE